MVLLNDFNDDGNLSRSFIALLGFCTKLIIFLLSACWHVIPPLLVYLNLTNMVQQQKCAIKVSFTIVNFGNIGGVMPIHKPLVNASFAQGGHIV
jgi:hypothetical protein